MRLCAYCKSPGPLTREEIFPKFLSEKVGYTTFVDQTRDGAVFGPVTVRDVCSQCNGVRLSELDNYVASLYRDYFSKPVDAPVDILFRYNYHLLARWLLKAFYNSARARRGGGPSRDLFEKNVPYILGERLDPCFPTLVSVGVTTSSVASETEKAFGMPSVFHPFVHKFGDLGFYGSRVADAVVLSQFLSINSFLFIFVGFSDVIEAPDRAEITTGLNEVNRTFELSPSIDQVRITASVTDSRSYLFARKRFSFV